MILTSPSSDMARDGPRTTWYGLMALLVVLDGLHGLAVSAQIAATGVIGLALYRLLKRWTRRPRPFAAHGRIHAWTAPLDEFSFPSGHTTSVFALAILLALNTRDKRISLIYLITAIITGYSRIYLGQHFLTDVLMGSFLGVMTAILVHWIFAERFRSRAAA